MAKRDLTAETAEDKYNVEAEARARGIDAFKVRASNCVNDRLVRDLVNDFRRPISQSTSLIPPSRRDEPATPIGKNGWVDAAPLTAPDTRWIDRQIDAQDARDKATAMRARIENALAQDLMNKGDE
jgi:hypothetical protein